MSERVSVVCPRCKHGVEIEIGVRFDLGAAARDFTKEQLAALMQGVAQVVSEAAAIREASP